MAKPKHTTPSVKWAKARHGLEGQARTYIKLHPSNPKHAWAKKIIKKIDATYSKFKNKPKITLQKNKQITFRNKKYNIYSDGRNDFIFDIDNTRLNLLIIKNGKVNEFPFASAHKFIDVKTGKTIKENDNLEGRIIRPGWLSVNTKITGKQIFGFDGPVPEFYKRGTMPAILDFLLFEKKASKVKLIPTKDVVEKYYKRLAELPKYRGKIIIEKETY